MARLSDQVIAVIGGTSGIGLAAARTFVDEGAKVVITGRNADKVGQASKLLGSDGMALEADASDSGTAKMVIDKALATYGRFSGLYHVAGGSGRRMGDGPLHELTDEGLDATFRINFNALVYSNRAAVQAFLKTGTGGTILNMGSVLAFAPSPGFFATHAYAAAKAAIIGFSKSIASYYAGDNIRVNVLAPALVETPMARRAAGDEEIISFTKTKQPLDGGRIGQPEDLTAVTFNFCIEHNAFLYNILFG